MKNAVVFDVDGVLLNTSFIFKEILDLKLKGDAKWDYFMSNCNSNKVTVIPNSFEFFFKFLSFPETDIFISTARNEKCREETYAKLLKECFIIPQGNLYMRKDGDYRSSQEVKKEHLIEISKTHNILAFIDDELVNCEVAKEMGILALRKV